MAAPLANQGHGRRTSQIAGRSLARYTGGSYCRPLASMTQSASSRALPSPTSAPLGTGSGLGGWEGVVRRVVIPISLSVVIFNRSFELFVRVDPSPELIVGNHTPLLIYGQPRHVTEIGIGPYSVVY